MSRFFIGFRDRNRPSRNGRFRRGSPFAREFRGLIVRNTDKLLHFWLPAILGSPRLAKSSLP